MPLCVFPKCFLPQLCEQRSMSVEQLLDVLAGVDLDGVEFYWPFLPQDSDGRTDKKALHRYRELAERQGRRIPMLCYSPDFTKLDRADRQREVSSQTKAIDAAAELGATYCRVLSGQARPGVAREQGIWWVVECIQQAIEHAARRGIVLVMENHYKDGYWQYPEFAMPMGIYLEILDRIEPSAHFGVNFDPSNAVIAGEDPLVFLQAVKDRVRTLHASERYLKGGTLADLRAMERDPHKGYAQILEHGAPGRGFIDYEGIFAILREIGFDGWISIEDGSDPKTGLADIAESAAFLRGMMNRYDIA